MQYACAPRVERSSDTRYGVIRRTLGELGDWFGCHQLPERSFYLRGVQFPVCARCTGVIAGQLCAVSAAIIGARAPIYFGIILMIPMGIDWAVQYYGVRESRNARRIITGFLGGAGYITILLCIAATIIRMLQPER